MKLEWHDQQTLSTLTQGKGTVWLLELDGQWYSNTPPIFGHWESREAAKAAVVNALKEQARELLTALERISSEGRNVR